MRSPVAIILASALLGSAQVRALDARDSHAITGIVVRVVDGDTIVVGTNRVRLAAIDTPERRQAYGQAAKDALAEKAEGVEVVVRCSSRDRYGRIVGTVYADGRNLNRELVAEGHAWCHPTYCTDTSLLQLQESAALRRLGLWASASPVAPWEFRERKTSSSGRLAKPAYRHFAFRSLACGPSLQPGPPTSYSMHTEEDVP